MNYSPYITFFNYFFFAKKGTYAKWAVEDLFFKFSYRYKVTDENNKSNPIAYYRKAVKLLFRKNKSQLLSCNVFYNGNTKYNKDLEDYFKFINLNNQSIVCRDNLPNELNFFEKFVNFFYLSFLFAFLQLKVVFKKETAKDSLILLELTEALLLSKIALKYDVKNISLFSAFEKDVLFLSYYLSKELNLHVKIIPSSNPISMFYKRVFCDTFVFTAPFQKKEYEILKNNWSVKEFENWPPFGSDKVLINNVDTEIREKVIGFISSGLELRRFLKFTSFNDNEYLAEIHLIEFLNKFITENPDYSLIIYLHPLEKSTNENLEFVTKFYKESFTQSVRFAPINTPTKQSFNLCNIGVSGFSSAQMERLWAGHKTLFAPFHYLSNYFNDIVLDSISGTSDLELEKLIKDNIGVSSSEFFLKYNLEPYIWKSMEKKQEEVIFKKYVSDTK